MRRAHQGERENRQHSLLNTRMIRFLRKLQNSNLVTLTNTGKLRALVREFQFRVVNIKKMVIGFSKRRSHSTRMKSKLDWGNAPLKG